MNMLYRLVVYIFVLIFVINKTSAEAIGKGSGDIEPFIRMVKGWFESEPIVMIVQPCFRDLIDKYENLYKYIRRYRLSYKKINLPSSLETFYSHGFTAGLTLDHFTSCKIYSNYYSHDSIQKSNELYYTLILEYKLNCGDKYNKMIQKSKEKEVKYEEFSRNTDLLSQMYKETTVNYCLYFHFNS
jgi:hypothetical protein